MIHPKNGEFPLSKADTLWAQARPHLDAGENRLALVQGTYEGRLMGEKITRSGILIATDHRVVFYAKKMLGYDFESFPYHAISTFEQRKNLMGNTLTFTASGNTVQLKWINDRDALEQLVRTVRTRMHRQTTVTAHVASSGAGGDDDIMEQIRQLAELHRAAILTDTEYRSKKAELLARL